MRKKLALFGATALFITFAALMLFGVLDRPEASSNEHFGLVDAVYSPDDALPVTDLMGDTDVVTISALALRGSFAAYLPRTGLSDTLALNVELTVAPERRLAMGIRHYDNGVLQNTYDSEYEHGFIEQFTDGEWQVVHGLEFSYRDEPRFKDPVLLQGEQSLRFLFPLHEPGEYRVTYYFRDYIPRDEAAGKMQHSTGAELYTVSHTVTVPEPSGKPFDLIAASIRRGNSDSGAADLNIHLLFRSNSGEIPYISANRARLEMLDGDRWVDAPVSEGYEAATVAPQYFYSYYNYHHFGESPSEESLAYSFLHPFSRTLEQNYFSAYANVAVADPTAQYRLIIEFSEKTFRRGERYVLTLNLDFS